MERPHSASSPIRPVFGTRCAVTMTTRIDLILLADSETILVFGWEYVSYVSRPSKHHSGQSAAKFRRHEIKPEGT